MTLIIDGVFLQQEDCESERFWSPLLPLLAGKLDMPIVLLDRGNKADLIRGIEVVPFPTFKPKFSPHDSALLQRICTHYSAHAFLSTHFTTPLHTPSVMLVRDMCSDKISVELHTRERQEKQTAVAHARRHVCISQNTQDDLLSSYPELHPSHISVAYSGADERIFKPASVDAIAAFRAEHGLTRPYFLTLSEIHHSGQKINAPLSDAVAAASNVDFDILCIGANSDGPKSYLMPNGCRILHLVLDEKSRATAYSGAEALVYCALERRLYSLIDEAMSCGCPIIEISNSTSIGYGHDAPLVINDSTLHQLAEAMRSMRAPAGRAQLSAASLLKVAPSRLESVADALVKSIYEIQVEERAGRYSEFYKLWTRLRGIQGEVDIVA